MVAYHKGSISRALMDLFPNIGLDKSKLYYLSMSLFVSSTPLQANQLFFSFLAPWSEASNRRKFFEEYAKVNGFDPLVPSNWYSQPSEKIMMCKVYQLPPLSSSSFYLVLPSLISLNPCRGPTTLFDIIKMQLYKRFSISFLISAWINRSFWIGVSFISPPTFLSTPSLPPSLPPSLLPSLTHSLIHSHSFLFCSQKEGSVRSLCKRGWI